MSSDRFDSKPPSPRTDLFRANFHRKCGITQTGIKENTESNSKIRRGVVPEYADEIPRPSPFTGTVVKP